LWKKRLIDTVPNLRCGDRPVVAGISQSVATLVLDVFGFSNSQTNALSPRRASRRRSPCDSPPWKWGGQSEPGSPGA